MARTAGQDEKLNDLYAEREAMEDAIMSMPNNRPFEDFAGWLELDKEIEEMIAPQAELMCVCDENIFCQKCFNKYQESEMYGDYASDMSDLRLQQAAKVCL